MAKKIVEQTLVDTSRKGCYEARKITYEKLDREPIVDIVRGSPDTLASALDRINRGTMTYEEFKTLEGGGDFDYEDDESLEDFDEGEYYEVENDSGKYYDKDKESRILAAEPQDTGKKSKIQPKTQGKVDEPDDKSDKE